MRERIAQKAWDGDGIPIEETNVAGIGSKEDKATRKQSAQTERAWVGVGLQPGLWVWRIEEFKVVPWPREKYGQFHEGDSYIILHAHLVPGTGRSSEQLDRDIYFWLGRKTSLDEKGTAAYKTVELDDYFDGQPSQHRVVQGQESQQFHQLFPHGLAYLAGGVESGFSITQVDVFMHKLYQLKRNARRQIIIQEEECRRESLNHRDCFLLDMGHRIYTWFGEQSSPFVKNDCCTRAANMVRSRHGLSRVVREADSVFWEALGGDGPVTPADQVQDDAHADHGEKVLYACNVNDERELEVVEVGRGELSRNMLDPSSVMMLDTRKELLLWLGKSSSEVERRIAFKIATHFLTRNGRSVDETPIAVLKQGFGRKSKIWASTFPA